MSATVTNRTIKARAFARAGTTALTLFMAHAAWAMPLTVPQVQTRTTVTAHYVCKNDQSIAVTYINTKNDQSFALMTVDGRKLLFVNVLSGSGAKYAAERYVWWTKGPQATLTSETAGAKAAPLLADCRERGK